MRRGWRRCVQTERAVLVPERVEMMICVGVTSFLLVEEEERRRRREEGLMENFVMMDSGNAVQIRFLKRGVGFASLSCVVVSLARVCAYKMSCSSPDAFGGLTMAMMVSTSISR